MADLTVTVRHVDNEALVIRLFQSGSKTPVLELIAYDHSSSLSFDVTTYDSEGRRLASDGFLVEGR